MYDPAPATNGAENLASKAPEAVERRARRVSWFKRFLRKEVFRQARVGLRRFQALQTLPDAEKNLIRHQIIHCETRIAASEFPITWLEFLQSAFALVSVAACMSIPFVASHYLATSISGWRIVVAGYLFVLVWGAAGSAIFLPVLLPKLLYGRFKKVGLGQAFFCALGVMTYVFVIVNAIMKLEPHSLGWIRFIFLCGISGAVVYWTLGFTLISIPSAMKSLIIDRGRTLYPNAYLVDGLLTALLLVQNSGSNWGEISFKREFMAAIEKVASIVDKFFLGALATHDKATDAWLVSRMSEIASAFRAKKTWVCTPRLDTRRFLIDSLNRSLINAALGNWDALERMVKEDLPAGERPARIFRLLQALLTAGAPALALFLVQQVPRWAIGPPLSEYLTAGVVLWGVLSLLSLDPAFEKKMEAVKSILPFALPKQGK